MTMKPFFIPVSSNFGNNKNRTFSNELIFKKKAGLSYDIFHSCFKQITWKVSSATGGPLFFYPL